MRLKNPNARSSPPPPVPAGAAVRSGRRRLWIALVVLVPLLGAAGWGAWAVWGPDPLREVHAALDRRDFHAADELLAKRLAERPDDHDARLLAARSARRAGDSARAFDHLRAYKEKAGADAAYELESRLLRAQSGDAAELNRLFAEYAARPDAPLVMEAYLEGQLRAVASRGTGRSDADTEEAALAAVEASMADLLRAVDLWLAARPGRADQVQGRLWRARALLAANTHAEGVAALREAVALDPDHLEARFQLALGTSLTAPDQSRGHLEALLARYPDKPFIRLGLANTYRMLGRAPDARRLYEGLLAGPHRTDALVELGLLDLDEGNVGDAEPRLRKALELAPNAPETNIAMSRCQQLAGRPDEAAKYRKRFDEIEAERKKPRGPVAPRP